MSIRLRHVALCTADLWGTEAAMAATLRLAVVHRDKTDPHYKLRNGIFALQDTFIEVATPAGPGSLVQPFLDKRGDGAYMACLQVDDLDTVRSRMEALGIRTVISLDDRRHGDVTISTAVAHPSDVGGTMISFDQVDPPAEPAWAGPAWRDYRRDDVVRDIVGVELASREPEKLARRLGELLDVEVEGTVLPLAQGRITVAPVDAASADGLVAIELGATDRTRAGEQHTFAGTAFRLT